MKMMIAAMLIAATASAEEGYVQLLTDFQFRTNSGAVFPLGAGQLLYSPDVRQIRVHIQIAGVGDNEIPWNNVRRVAVTPEVIDSYRATVKKLAELVEYEIPELPPGANPAAVRAQEAIIQNVLSKGLLAVVHVSAPPRPADPPLAASPAYARVQMNEREKGKIDAATWPEAGDAYLFAGFQGDMVWAKAGTQYIKIPKSVTSLAAPSADPQALASYRRKLDRIIAATKDYETYLSQQAQLDELRAIRSQLEQLSQQQYLDSLGRNR